MTKTNIFALLITLIFGCAQPQKSKEILFQVRTNDKEDLEIFEDGIIPWISIKNPEKELDNLIGKEEIVLENNEAILLIDYPLSMLVEIEIKSQKNDGFSRGELIQIISWEYNRIYSEEEETAEVKTIPLEERKGLINRNETDGKYGIWGHDIDDLDLSGIIVHENKGEKPKLELYIES